MYVLWPCEEMEACGWKEVILLEVAAVRVINQCNSQCDY